MSPTERFDWLREHGYSPTPEGVLMVQIVTALELFTEHPKAPVLIRVEWGAFIERMPGLFPKVNSTGDAAA